MVGAAHVLTDPAVTSSYTVDWTGRFVGSARARSCARRRPSRSRRWSRCVRSTASRSCRRGATRVWWAGGHRGRPTQVVLSTRRLSAIEPVDTATREVTAAAGATIGDLQRGGGGGGPALRRRPGQPRLGDPRRHGCDERRRAARGAARHDPGTGARARGGARGRPDRVAARAAAAGQRRPRPHRPARRERGDARVVTAARVRLRDAGRGWLRRARRLP